MVGAGDSRPLAPVVLGRHLLLNTFLSKTSGGTNPRRGRVRDATYLIGQDLRTVKEGGAFEV